MLGAGGSNLALRGYGTVTRLADSRMLLTSGLDFALAQVQVPGAPQPIQFPGTPSSPRFGTLNIHASGTATAAASADSMNAFRYPPIAAWRSISSFSAMRLLALSEARLCAWLEKLERDVQRGDRSGETGVRPRVTKCASV
jgi:hypothetical protein